MPLVFPHVENEWVAVNICLIPPPSLSSVAIDLSTQLCEPTLYTLRPPGEFTLPLQPKRGFPHVTLRQLFCRNDHIEPLCEAVQSAVLHELQKQQHTGTGGTMYSRDHQLILEVMERVIEGPVFDQQAPPGSSTTEDVLLPNIRLKKNNSVIQNLHEAVMGSTNDFVATSDQINNTRAVAGSEELSAFHPLWPGNVSSHKWTENFTEKSSFEQYDPHITLGAAYRSKLASSNLVVVFGNSFSFPLCGSKICISRMGNCCSCFELLAQIDL